MSLIVVLVSGCGQQTGDDSNSVHVPPSASAPATVPTGPPPGLTVSGPPKTPTDKLESPGWTEGYVVRGGTGPCYGLLDVDGFPYAMYSDSGVVLKEKDHVRVRVVPSKLRIDCGEGTPVRMEAVQHVS